MRNLLNAIKNMVNEYNEQKKVCTNNMSYICQPGRLANITSC